MDTTPVDELNLILPSAIGSEVGGALMAGPVFRMPVLTVGRRLLTVINCRASIGSIRSDRVRTAGRWRCDFVRFFEEASHDSNPCTVGLFLSYWF